MQTDYSVVMNLAIELHNAGADRNRRAIIEHDYDAALDTLVDGLLVRFRKATPTIRVVENDFDEIAASSDEALAPLYDRVRYDIINRIGDVAGPTLRQQAWVTRAVGLGGVLAVVAFGATYMGVRQYSVTPVTAPIEAEMGLHQRADALAKVIRYNQFFRNDSARSMVLKKILFWPIEPTDTEARNGSEFAVAILDGARLLQQSHRACKIPARSGDVLSTGEIDLVEYVVTRLRAKETRWQKPPVMTILSEIRAKYPC